MVLEALIKPKILRSYPYIFFLYVLFTTLLSALIAFLIFPSATSILTLFLTIICTLPLFCRLISSEERVFEATSTNPVILLFSRNSTIIVAYSLYFLGILTAFTFFSIFLPEEVARDFLSYQIVSVRSITGMATSVNAVFSTIFFNNLKVMLIAFFLSFFYGTGALFIISWNASVIGTFIGLHARSVATSKLYAFAYALTLGTGSLALHGIPEIIAYFVSGIAGGVLSRGLIEGRYTREIVKDSLLLFIFSVLLLFVAAVVESFLVVWHAG